MLFLVAAISSVVTLDVVHSKVGVFKVVAGRFCSSNLGAAVRAARGSATAPAGSFGWAISAGMQEGYKHTQLAVNSGKVGSL